MTASISRTVGPPRLAGAIDRVLVAARCGVPGVVLRVATLAALAGMAAGFHRVFDPGIICPFRRITGVPCPFCGGTTVFVELGSGHPWRAFLANPVVLFGAVSLALAPLGLGDRWWMLSPRARAWVLGALVGAELWQLVRLGVVRL